ncbi:MAG TPA: lipid-A-disaccharide synthase [Gammaproteobacteria bacterium]|nr:lipid-A-disaccharide synthase [Gammaproteobacteria bacterium]
MRIGIVAGEPSGDILGSEIILALRRFYPDAEFIGVAGPKMIAAGATSLFPMEKLSVMGFTEVLMRAKELLALRKSVKEYFLKNPPDVYIGIDSPDFNLPIELELKKNNIKTAHCNSPTIWAWREKRILKIKKAVDLMLVLFPFEKKYYEQAHIPVNYIGHVLADHIPLDPKPLPTAKIIALLPGSRKGEISYIGPILLKAAEILFKKYPDIKFLAPMANQSRLEQFEKQYKTIAPELPLKITLGNTREVMESARVVALASGTATLEGLLVKRPMVVLYKSSFISYWIVRSLIKIPYVSLPNILSGEKIISEWLQYDATPENVAADIENYLNHPEKIELLQKKFVEIHKTLKCNAAERAAEAIAVLLSS